MRLIFASNNAHKLAEVQAIMPAGVEVVSLREVGFVDEIDETGSTLEENSLIKAETVWNWVRENGVQADGVFADDTGLEIAVLDGAPGVYTARWAYLEPSLLEDATCPLREMELYAANRRKALWMLEGKTNRKAQFRTVITWIKADGQQLQVDGVVRGTMTTEERGEGGFGYDSIFVPEGYDRTFAELPAETKNSISHRARALEALVRELEK